MSFLPLMDWVPVNFSSAHLSSPWHCCAGKFLQILLKRLERGECVTPAAGTRHRWMAGHCCVSCAQAPPPLILPYMPGQSGASTGIRYLLTSESPERRGWPGDGMWLTWLRSNHSMEQVDAMPARKLTLSNTHSHVSQSPLLELNIRILTGLCHQVCSAEVISLLDYTYSHYIRQFWWPTIHKHAELQQLSGSLSYLSSISLIIQTIKGIMCY